jgi:RNA recognition motif-containing protein
VNSGFAAYSPSSSVTSLLDSLLLKFSLFDKTTIRPDANAGDRERRCATEVQVMGRKLYVGNLPYEVGETELQELFARAGSVESAKVMRDQMTGRARGFGFVEMSTDEEAQHAIDSLNGTQVGGRNLTVNEARPQAARGGGGGGGFGGGGHRRREPRW